MWDFYVMQKWPFEVAKRFLNIYLKINTPSSDVVVGSFFVVEKIKKKGFFLAFI